MNTYWIYLWSLLVLICALRSVALPELVHAKSVYVIGVEEHPWDEGGATLEGMDATSHPGWIAPEQVAPEENLSPGGQDPEEEMTPISGWITWRSREAPLGSVRVWKAFVDLGGVFGVHRVRFSPYFSEWSRPPWPIRVGVSRGKSEDLDAYGLPIFDMVWSGELEGRQEWVEVHFPTHSARYVGIERRARSPNFAIRRIEVYGEGFVSESRYVSPVVDLGKVSDLDRIRWKGKRDGDARISLRTRTGMDEDPHLYWREIKEGELSRLNAFGEELTRETYERLPFREKGGITPDREHWSPWSGPYPFEEGEEGAWTASPSPRRYIQIQVELLGDYKSQREIDLISFEYSQPPLAQKVMGEIVPTQVRASERTTFHYAITPMMERGDRGFDTLEIFTPIRVDTVRSVRWDGVEKPIVVEYLDDPTRFVVHFPRVKLPLLLVEVTFDASVLRYGTMFRGRVFDSTVDEVPQWVIPGDADFTMDSSTLLVKTVLSDTLIASMEISPNPFTPNGDGVNDEVWIVYDLLQLTEDAPVRMEVYDVSGRLIRTIYAGENRSGRYQRSWDGRDVSGKLVSPGVYLLYVSVQADAMSDRTVSALVVSY